MILPQEASCNGILVSSRPIPTSSYCLWTQKWDPIPQYSRSTITRCVLGKEFIHHRKSKILVLLMSGSWRTSVQSDSKGNAKEQKITLDEAEFVNKDTLNSRFQTSCSESYSWKQFQQFLWLKLGCSCLHSVALGCPNFPGTMSFAHLSEPMSTDLGNASFINMVFHTFWASNTFSSEGNAVMVSHPWN